MEIAFGVKFFGALFAIMNPLVNLPFFLALTDGKTAGEQRRIALQVAFYSAVMTVVVAIGVLQILDFFGIGLADFRVAGGLVLALIALHMLNGRSSPAHAGSAEEKPHVDASETIAFYPMTFPMIVGPGTITTLVVFLQQARGPADYVACAVVLAGMLVFLAVVLFFASAIGTRVSQTLRTIVSRLTGMILLAIAVEMIAAGLVSLLLGLARGA